jgi:hypothetical protein
MYTASLGAPNTLLKLHSSDFTVDFDSHGLLADTDELGF